MSEFQVMSATGITPLAFGKLFMEYHDAYTAIAKSYVRDEDTAEDIVSECFTSFWDRRESIDLKSSPEAYILKSVKNRCLNWLRDNSRVLAAEGPMDPDLNAKVRAMLSEISVLETDDMGSIFSSEVEKIFRNFLADMPELPRNIFMASRFEDMTYEEIAEKYSVSPRKVKREMQKALETLRASLKDYLPLLLLMCIR